MRYKGLLYAWGEALRSLYRNKWMTIASIGVVVVTLLMLGGFMLVNLNLNHCLLYTSYRDAGPAAAAF